MGKPKTITIDDVEYVRKDSIQSTQLAEELDGMKYCVIRTYSAGVHIGYVKRCDGQEIELIKSRRLHYWDGACSLSQVAIDGVDESNSRIAMELPEIILTDCIEIIPCSEKSEKFFKGAKVWKK